MQYQVLPVEKDFIHRVQGSEEVAYLQRDTCTKLQEINHNNKCYYSSTRDQSELIRLILFAFLSKTFRKHSLFNQNNLNKFKQVIYGSKLNHLTDINGVTTEQLLKIFADKFSGLWISLQADEEIRQIMNCEPFVEEIMVSAIAQQINELPPKVNSSELDKDALNSAFIEWFKCYLDLQIIITDSSIVAQTQEEIFLLKNNDHYLRQSYRQRARNSASSVSTDPKMIESLHDLRMSKDLVLQSIHFTESCLLSKHPSKNMENQNIEQQPDERQWNLQRSAVQSKSRPERTSLFDILCCRVND